MIILSNLKFDLYTSYEDAKGGFDMTAGKHHKPYALFDSCLIIRVNVLYFLKHE